MRGRIHSFLIVAGFLLSLGTMANARAEIRCADAARIESEILPLFEIRTVQGDSVASDCGRNQLAYKVAQAILYLKDLGTKSFPADKFDLNFIGDSPFEFFRERAKTIVIQDASDPDCTRYAVAYVGRGENVLNICPRANQLPFFQLTSTMIHEARHVDGPFHVVCNHGPYEDYPACDERYADGGSYGIEVEYAVKVARNSSLPKQIRQQARSQAVVDFLERFNQRPFGVKQIAVLQTIEGDVRLFDGTSVGDTIHGLGPAAVLTSHYGVPTLFEPIQGSAYSFFQSPDMTEATGSLVEEFRNGLLPSVRESLVDVGYFDGDVACMLFRDRLRCQIGEAWVEKPLHAFTARGFLEVSSQSKGTASGRMAIVSSNGTIHMLPQPLERIAKTNLNRLPQITSVPSAPSTVVLNKTRFSLSNDGSLLKWNKKTAQWQPEAATINQIYRKLLKPIEWSKSLQEL